MNHRTVRFLFIFVALTIVTPLWAGGSSLRFFGNGTGDIDRVKIQISPQVPADVGAGDFTIEFWMKANPGDNTAGNCVTGNDGWMSGNIMFDRDVLGVGDFGEYGISLFNDGIAFGVHNGTTGDGICGTTNVADGFWHHVAVTRRFSDGRLQLFVDGVREASLDGPVGDISYNDSHSNPDPNDPFLVIGAQKRDDPGSLSYNGWIDEIRISSNLRYNNTITFTRPGTNFSVDGNTLALYHFDESSGNTIIDSDGQGSNGVRNFGGSPAGPIWSPDKAPLGPLDQTPVSDFFQPIITSGLSSPVAITHAGDATNRLFITDQPGVIYLWNGTTLSQFMDIQSIVNFGGEQGLLSTAFHPDYENNGYFYVYFTNDSGDNEVDRFNVLAGDPNKGDPNSRVIILNIPHPGQSNHNGGQLQFGPEGYLYIGTGDGGGSGDPGENAQDINELLGKILRIDIGDGTPPYTIPPDNPYAGGTPGRDEIWAIGVRNPWRFGFDRLTGDQFIADVGQNLWEEVDFQAFGTAGGVNWGWDDREGAHCFEPPSGCQTAGRTDPIMEYSHGSGCSISGGYRYRGTAIPQIHGRYYFGDFCSGSVWGSTQAGNGNWSLGTALSTSFNISGFGEDQNGEMYLINLNGAVYKFTGTDADLALTVTDNPDPVFITTPLTYTLTVTNDGPKTATSVILIDELPATATFISSSHTGCIHNSGIVTCDLGNMNSGDSTQFTIDVMPTALGPMSNYTIVSANENDLNAINNSDTETTQVIALTGTELALTKSDSADPVPLGSNLTYTIQVTNNGPEDATGVTVTDTLPGSVTFVSASPGCSEVSGTVTCDIGNLAASASVSVQIDVTPTVVETISNTATVTGNESDPFPANNSDTEDTVVFDPNACLFCDEFDDGILDPNWTYIKNSSFWSEDGASLIGSNTRKTTAVATVFAGCLICHAETTMRTAGGFGNRLWLLHHYVDKNNVVELLMKEEKDVWVLKHRINRAVVAKQKYPMTIDPNTDYVVRITYDGTSYTASVNGTALSPSLTPGGPVTQGTAGLRVKATTGTFARIELN